MLLFVTMRQAGAATYVEPRDAIARDWGAWLAGFGVLPVLIPNGLPEPEAYFDRLPGRGLILTGGDDVPEPGGMPSARDESERRLLAAAVARGLPVFGVCRGLQFLNLWFGGRVRRTLPEPHVRIDHPVTLLRPVADLPAGTEIRVNSFHDHGVLAEDVAPDLHILAATAGGVVEAVDHGERPIVAVQWHPERPGPGSAFDRLLFYRWLDRCALSS